MAENEPVSQELPKPRGFTLLELSFVISVIGILIALLLPAVVAARDAARRTQCVNNLCQLSIALRNYETAHRVLPPGVLNDTGPVRNKPDGYHIGWLVQLLPYLDESLTYQHVDFSVGAYHKNNRPVRATIIPTLACPSAPDPKTGWPHYAGCHHDVEAPIDSDNHGVFFLNSHIHSSEIPDGLAHTLFVGEKLCDARDLTWMSGTVASLRNTGTPINKTPVRRDRDQAWEADMNAGEDPLYTGWPGRMMGNSSTSSSPVPSTPPVQQNPPAIADDPSQLYVGGFGSEHPGVANFLFGDGAVRSISQTIDFSLYQQLGHRADGKLLKDRSFE